MARSPTRWRILQAHADDPFHDAVLREMGSRERATAGLSLGLVTRRGLSRVWVVSVNVPQERRRRQSKTEDVLALLYAKPSEWIGVHELAEVGGFAGWRSRVVEARIVIEKDGGQLVWNENCRQSAYRFIPPASEPSPERWTIPGAPYGCETFELTPPEPR